MFARASRRRARQMHHLQLARLRAETSLKALFLGALDAILIANDAGYYVDGNPAALALLGVSHEQLVTMRVRDIVPASDVAGAEQAWQHFLAVGSMEGEIELRRPDGELRTVEYRARAHFSPERHLSILRDITERRRAEVSRNELQVRVEAAQRLETLGMLTAGITHEISNPVFAMMGNLELLQPLLSDEPERAYLRDAIEAAERVLDIVRDVKLFARIDHNRAESVDLHGVLDSTLRIVAGQLRDKGAVVRDYGEVPPVRGDPSRLGQVFLNLMVNAAESLSRSTTNTVTIRTFFETTRGRVVIEVADTGAGIAADVLPGLFTTSLTTKPHGTGLGLIITHQLVQSMGGTICATSSDKGATFRVELAPAEQVARPLTAQPG